MQFSKNQRREGGEGREVEGSVVNIRRSCNDMEKVISEDTR